MHPPAQIVNMPHTNRKPGYRARKGSASSRATDELLQRSRAASINSPTVDKLPQRPRNNSTVSHPPDEIDTARDVSTASREIEGIAQKPISISTTSRPTPSKTSPHGAGTSASWSSANNTNNTRFERLDKMAKHNGLDNSPFMPKTTIELLKHEKEFTHDMAQEQLRTLKNMITSSETMKRTGHSIGSFMAGKVMPVMGGIWEPGMEKKTKAAWPSQAEYKRYGDSAANSTFKLPRHLPPPRNKLITDLQVRMMIGGGMNATLALSFLGKDPQGRLEELQWDDMSILDGYMNDEQLIVEEARYIVGGMVGSGMFHAIGIRDWESESFVAERNEFNERAVRAMGAWGELLDEVNGLRVEFAERI